MRLAVRSFRTENLLSCNEILPRSGRRKCVTRFSVEHATRSLAYELISIKQSTRDEKKAKLNSLLTPPYLLLCELCIQGWFLRVSCAA